MMFSQKPTLLVYVQRGGLLLEGGRVPAAKLPFPEDVFQYMEVLDQARLQTLCQDFFNQHTVRGRRVLVVLDRALLFDKTLPDAKNTPGALKTFGEAMPFEPSRRTLTIFGKKQLVIYATNSDLIQILHDALEAAGAKVVAATPAPAYGLPQQSPTKSELVAHFLNDKVVQHEANFITAPNA